MSTKDDNTHYFAEFQVPSLIFFQIRPGVNVRSLTATVAKIHGRGGREKRPMWELNLLLFNLNL